MSYKLHHNESNITIQVLVLMFLFSSNSNFLNFYNVKEDSPKDSKPWNSCKWHMYQNKTTLDKLEFETYQVSKLDYWYEAKYFRLHGCYSETKYN